MFNSAKLTVVGAGPGDPELITVKALNTLKSAKVVLYDALINRDLLEYAPQAEHIFVGKRKDKHRFPQDEINELIVKYALERGHVVRLKGGDPFIYGRGGEEVEALVQAGIDVEVIPGITASLGAASYAGIPLTHRDTSQSVRFVTGHRVENTVNVDWPEFTKAGQTLVIYMGLVGLQRICERLITHGAPPERPVALVENATLPEQRVLIGRLDSVADIAIREKVSGPTVVIIGEVVALKMRKQVTNS
ncbi:uroporphyrinogen-III C-methyltransferase [uncultured Christiangramia sp.]|uniref:uroporphyrinogen-III C-methyltransferase n=1 Tax=uncultured Christiangramia sp. TaxID=503836 RepID=UPI0025F66A11|nr:uroporphyrinogen-III C-methyltransferase [uncultured Christiangramia sp.]